MYLFSIHQAYHKLVTKITLVLQLNNKYSTLKYLTAGVHKRVRKPAHRDCALHGLPCLWGRGHSACWAVRLCRQQLRQHEGLNKGHAWEPSVQAASYHGRRRGWRKTLRVLQQPGKKPEKRRWAINLSIPKKTGYQIKDCVHFSRRALVLLL